MLVILTLYWLYCVSCQLDAFCHHFNKALMYVCMYVLRSKVWYVIKIFEHLSPQSVCWLYNTVVVTHKALSSNDELYSPRHTIRTECTVTDRQRDAIETKWKREVKTKIKTNWKKLVTKTRRSPTQLLRVFSMGAIGRAAIMQIWANHSKPRNNVVADT